MQTLVQADAVAGRDVGEADNALELLLVHQQRLTCKLLELLKRFQPVLFFRDRLRPLDLLCGAIFHISYNVYVHCAIQVLLFSLYILFNECWMT